MVKRTPAPRPLPSIVIVPPWKATTSWAMARPSPVPPPSRRARAVESGEALEDPVPLVRRDAGPVVGNAEHGGGLGLVQRDRDRRCRVPRRVVEQVAHRPHELIEVGHELRARHRARVHPVRGAAAQSARFGEDDLVEVDRIAMGGVERRRVRGREGEEVFDEPLQPHRVVEDVALGHLPVRLLRVREVDLELRADAGQRAPQLVAGVGDETALPLGGVLEPSEHGVHGARQSADLVFGAGFGDATVEVLRADLLHLASHRLDRAQGAARHHPRDRAHEQEQGRQSEQRGGGSGSMCSRRPAPACRRRRWCTRPCS